MSVTVCAASSFTCPMVHEDDMISMLGACEMYHAVPTHPMVQRTGVTVELAC